MRACLGARELQVRERGQARQHRHIAVRHAAAPAYVQPLQTLQACGARKSNQSLDISNI